jgi:hypothetical protein
METAILPRSAACTTFRGRQVILQETRQWLQSAITPDRVISLVAAGGTGKTALVNEALRQTAFSDRGGVFVWSFYEDPNTDAFLRAAHLYFSGEGGSPAGGLLERLQLALSGMPLICSFWTALSAFKAREGTAVEAT